jgi:SAM-dependent methyltransferase
MINFFSKIKTIPYLISLKANFGFCPICEKKTLFIKQDPWLRDHYHCMFCKSIPRQRAIVNALNIFSPAWPAMTIHESSPCGVSSDFIRKKCKNYSVSYFFPDILPGSYHNGARCENLEKMTFENDTFDIFITQDVFEHVNHPDVAFREIARVLKPGGFHIFTVPLYRDLQVSQPRIVEKDGEIQHLLEPVYHWNPISSEGSLVTFDYGLDFTELIFRSSGMNTTIYLQKDPKMGLDAEFLEVFISQKKLCVDPFKLNPN